MDDQFTFRDIIEEMDAIERDKLDAHRARVQAFFDGLSSAQKCQLGAWMHGPEWQTCQALSAAACDFYRARSNQHQKSANGSMHEELSGWAK